MFGKLCITASFGMIYVFSAELFPTVVRNIGVGTSSTMARVGAFIASLVAILVSLANSVTFF
jgi:OCT family organic cation transporter-like MFS transporter 4/5